MKIACILVPHFAVQTEYQRRPELRGQPMLVVEVRGSRRTVLDYSVQASGLYPGMALPQALARVSGAALAEADTPYYQASFDRVLDALEHCSPLVEGAWLGCAYVGLDGLETLYGGERRLLAALLGTVPVGLEAQLGVAGAKFPAYVTAISGQPGAVAVAPADVQGFLSPLSVDILPVSAQMKLRLVKFGLSTLGQLASLPVGALQAQFGPEGRLAWSLANGLDHRPLVPRVVQEVVQESLSLPSPTSSLGTILTAAEVLVARAFSRPSLRGRYVRVATLQAHILRGGVWSKRIAYLEPVGDRERALSPLKSVLSRTTFTGPLEDLMLTLSGLTSESGRQGSLLAEVRRWEQLQDSLRQLEARLGQRPPMYRVRDLEPWSRIPERRQVLVPFDP